MRLPLLKLLRSHMSPFCEARVSSRVLPSLTADLVRPLDSRLRDHGFESRSFRCDKHNKVYIGGWI